MKQYWQGNKPIERRRLKPDTVVNLTATLKKLADRHGITNLNDLTVFSNVNDPFRRDTDSNHMWARWFRDGLAQLGKLNDGKSLHNRGWHYAFLRKVRMPTAGTHPNGHPKMSGDLASLAGKLYDGTDRAYQALNHASAAARWLGYIPFDKITDERNDKPLLMLDGDEVEFDCGVALACDVRAGIVEEYAVPSLDLFNWQPYVTTTNGRQKFRIALWTEKSSARERLIRFAREHDLDLYAPTGETSATMAYQMARTASEDGRPLVVLVFADCDPSGYQMLVSLSHKLRAFKEQQFRSLQFEVVAAGLTIEQVKDFERQGIHLPPNTLKESEKRAKAWRSAHDIEQIELDAICTLRPELFDDIIGKAINPWFDHDLETKVETAIDAYTDELRRAFNKAAKKQGKATLIEDALKQLRLALDQFDGAIDILRENVASVEFAKPDLALPEAETINNLGDGYISSEISLIEHVRLLKARKQYDE